MMRDSARCLLAAIVLVVAAIVVVVAVPFAAVAAVVGWLAMWLALLGLRIIPSVQGTGETEPATRNAGVTLGPLRTADDL